MSRIQKILTSIEARHQKAFIPFIMAGDPSLRQTLSLMHTLSNNGANIIELGIPFSDPMADGPVISKAHERAVANGINLEKVFNVVKEFRQQNKEVAIVLMGYLNPIESYGWETFAQTAVESDVDGVLVVDMPPEEGASFGKILQSHDVDLISLIAPTTTDERMQKFAHICSGFIYLVSLRGVTGATHLDVTEITKVVERIRRYIDLPIAVGFGIKDTKTANIVSKIADAVVVGSTFVELIHELRTNNEALIAEVGRLSHELASATYSV